MVIIQSVNKLGIRGAETHMQCFLQQTSTRQTQLHVWKASFIKFKIQLFLLDRRSYSSTATETQELRIEASEPISGGQ